MEISADKTEPTTNSIPPIEKKITASEKELETVNQFEYLGAILSEGGSKTKVLAKAVQQHWQH